MSTTCLSETIGDDCKLFLHQIAQEWEGSPMPIVVPVSTPSYQGSHAEGFHLALRALVDVLAETGDTGDHVNLFSNMISSEDIRYLQQVFRDFDLEGAVILDYSDSLDGPSWETYARLPAGGTPVAALRRRVSVSGFDQDNTGSHGSDTGLGRFRLYYP